MCENAADSLLKQCGRQYGFSREYGFSQDNSLRATDNISNITTLNIEGRKLLTSNKLKAEKNLAEFDQRASNVAKSRNFKFTAKLICNDVMLSRRNNSKDEVPDQIITKLLNE